MLHNEIIKFDGTDENYFEKFKYALLNKKESSRYPNDEEFREMLDNKNVYVNMRGENRLYLFERLENATTVETKAIWEHLDKGEYSIEHVMPQQLSSAWKRELGDDYERIHHTWLHRLANLTLTGYNSEYSNRPFIDKRDMENGFRQSGLRLNIWIGQQEYWGETELEERNEILLDTALEIWPYVTSDYAPPQKQLEFVTLDDDIVFTGKSISRFSFLGIDQNVDSWTDMYQQILMQLHSMDKVILTRLAVCEDSAVDLSLHFSTSSTAFSSCKMIDNNVFVWTGTDTQYKINTLRRLFSLFGIDPAELVFYLREDVQSDLDEVGRHSTRRKYWDFLLPPLREATGIFGNVNPTHLNWINGYPGYGGIAVACVANLDSARVELYMEMTPKERNKKLFDFLYSRKTQIEESAGMAFEWDRRDDIKASKIHASNVEIGIANEDDWAQLAEFHIRGCRAIIDAFSEHLQEYFSK